MEQILARIDQIITDCNKRDLVPSAEIVDALLDLRNEVERSTTLTPEPV